MGPIRKQADSIMRVLRSSTTVVHLVTLLEDMPVSETEEALAALRPTRIQVGTVIENMVIPSPLDRDLLVAEGDRPLQVRGLSAKQNLALAAEFAVGAENALQQQRRHERLGKLSVPLVQIDFDPGGIDEGSILAIADQLTGQLELEAA